MGPVPRSHCASKKNRQARAISATSRQERQHPLLLLVCSSIFDLPPTPQPLGKAPNSNIFKRRKEINFFSSFFLSMPYSFLHIAALRNDVVKAQLLIDGEAPDDVHVWKSQPIEHRGGNFIPVFVDERDASGWTPLMCAATHGHLEMCRCAIV
jgi:hypothetical protein